MGILIGVLLAAIGAVLALYLSCAALGNWLTLD